MMEALKKNDDCYFYYYSSCMKGDACPFRHEPTALGIETVCNFWKQGKCSKLHCNFRHMEVRKNRNVIPCYWESQPTGCRKPHCPFQHKSSRDGIQSESEGKKDLILPVGSACDSQDRSSSADREGSELENNAANFVSSPPVDPLVVNFEEESDNESVPSTTPVKRGGRNIHIKTLEEIRLERIQAESAAFYQYDDSDTEAVPSSSTPNIPPADSPKTRLGTRDTPEIELRKKITGRRSIQNGDTENLINKNKETPSEFKVLSLKEIRDRKRKNEENQNEDIEIKNKKTQVINRIKAIIVNQVEKESVNEITESNKNSPKKRSHSPVVFDIGGKKIKSIEPVISKTDADIKTSPSKPIVAVTGRKRPHHEDSNEVVTSTAVDNNVTSTSSSRPTRKIWRSSRQIRKVEEENNIKNISDNSNNSDNISNANVFTRKLRLKKNIVQPIISSSSSTIIEDDNNCKKYINNDNNSLNKICVPENDSCDKVTSFMPIEKSNNSKLINNSKRNVPSNLHVAPPDSNGDLDVDLSLLSPTQEGDISMSISKGADDILQDIDDLLNE